MRSIGMYNLRNGQWYRVWDFTVCLFHYIWDCTVFLFHYIGFRIPCGIIFDSGGEFGNLLIVSKTMALRCSYFEP